MSAFVDTSAFYAYLVSNDRYHPAVRAAIEDAVERDKPLFSSSFVLCETLGLLQARHGSRAVSQFMDRVYPFVEWRWIDKAAFDRVSRVVRRHAARGFSAVDASAVVCIEDRPGSICIAVDDDLKRFGFRVVPGE